MCAWLGGWRPGRGARSGARCRPAGARLPQLPRREERPLWASRCRGQAGDVCFAGLEDPAHCCPGTGALWLASVLGYGEGTEASPHSWASTLLSAPWVSPGPVSRVAVEPAVPGTRPRPFTFLTGSWAFSSHSGHRICEKNAPPPDTRVTRLLRGSHTRTSAVTHMPAPPLPHSGHGGAGVP